MTNEVNRTEHTMIKNQYSEQVIHKINNGHQSIRNKRIHNNDKDSTKDNPFSPTQKKDHNKIFKDTTLKTAFTTINTIINNPSNIKKIQSPSRPLSK
jgi:hypothetical protein